MESVDNISFASPEKDINGHFGDDENTIALTIEENFEKEINVGETVSNSVNVGYRLDIQKTNEWLKHLENNFDEVVIGGTDGTVRSDILANMESKTELATTQCRAVIRSLN